jgi:NAD(P)-dependent dehydrogenase (short-subunit alcohol dehydrogenase family)
MYFMKNVLITGIGRGIGKALAERFIKEGWKVIGTSQSGDIDYFDPHLEIHQLDLSDSGSINGCIKALTKTLSANEAKIDVLINNAGVLEDQEETRIIVDKLRKTLEVNLIGTIDFTEQILPLINNPGHIINISSQAGSLGDADVLNHSHAPLHYPAYKISKCALNMYTRTLAIRLAQEKQNITVSSVHPGWVKTDMGGPEAPVTPYEAAQNIYNLAISNPETGQFWFEGKKYKW